MTNVENELSFGRLTDVNLREAWAHEATRFTPWLSQNLDRLGESIGLGLELIGTEVGLPSIGDSFSADILARNVRDNSNVLIENQLESSDHNHLGQILTYLAGLEAKTVIWVARDFREAHLAAVNWLNENTLEDFAFFAIRLRVVRIGNSDYAPLFDILQKPNTWEKRLQTAARGAKEMSDLGKKRQKFWSYFLDQYPVHRMDGTGGGSATLWHPCASGNLIISYYVAKNEVGLFVRGPSQVPVEAVREHLRPHEEKLLRELGVELGTIEANSIGVLSDRFVGDFTDDDQIPNLAEWLSKRVTTYAETLNKLTLDIL